MTDLAALIRERELPMARWDVTGAGVDPLRSAPLARREYVLGELEHLWGTDTPDNIAHRLGYRDVGSLARTLCRWREHALAAQLTRLSA